MNQDVISSRRVILWAVDPFARELSFQKEIGRFISVLNQKMNAEIQPVYALVHALTHVPEERTRELCNELIGKAQEKFVEISRKIQLPNLFPLKVLEAHKNSIKDQVTVILEYARQINAEMIILGTRARKGPSRWVMGSFAETMTLRSSIPLFVLNPKVARTFAFKDILFPTDFSDESQQAFLAVLSFAKKMESRIHILHKFFYEPIPSPGVPFVLPPIYTEFEKQTLSALRAQAEKWEQEAQLQGVYVTSEVDTHIGESAANAILKKSRQAPCLIAMAAQSSPLEVVFLGSTTRQVLRDATVPVWIVHPTKSACSAPSISCCYGS